MAASVSFLALTGNASLGLWVAVGTAVFLGATALFLLKPYLAVALTIPLFAVLPTLKALLSPEIGPVKEVVTLAAVCAAALVYVFDRRRPDGLVSAAVAVLLVLYALNVGGGHGVAWAHGFRLTAEPLLLLLVGLTLREARRTLRLAVVSLVATCCAVGAYGLVQQAVGPWRLVDWGYAFDREVRTISGHLRSFGTLDEPFGYAAFLLFGLAAVMFAMRRRPLAYLCGALMLTGLAASYVRTAPVAASALVWLWLGRRGQKRSAALVLAAVATAVVVVLTQPHPTQSRSIAGRDAVVTLNGRISVWKDTIGNPADWPLGRGVGTTGTAAARATYTLRPPRSSADQATAVDSGYLATVADVGLVGLAVLLALFVRVVQLARARLPSNAAWLALASLAVFLVDAVSHSSFTGFPTAFLGLLLVGVALAAAEEEHREAQAVVAAMGPCKRSA